MSALTDLRARITDPEGHLRDRGTIAAELERAIAKEAARAESVFAFGRRLNDGPSTPRPDIVPAPQKVGLDPELTKITLSYCEPERHFSADDLARTFKRLTAKEARP